jgi:hypothetical protein
MKFYPSNCSKTRDVFEHIKRKFSRTIICINYIKPTSVKFLMHKFIASDNTIALISLDVQTRRFSMILTKLRSD